MKTYTLAPLAVAAALLGGCASFSSSSTPRAPDLLTAVNAATDVLSAQIRALPLDAPLIVTSAQNNDRLTQVCPEGRLVADMVSSRLTQHGYPVTEVRLTQRLRVTAEGETLLSREVSELADQNVADAVVAATWTTVENAPEPKRGPGAHPALTTYVTLKAIRIADGLTMGSHTFAVPNSWSCR